MKEAVELVADEATFQHEPVAYDCHSQPIPDEECFGLKLLYMRQCLSLSVL